ncbi:hypothetical protein GCM10009764_55610 [Nocardia ninae]|uniref:Uncharacterized protein n=1 Tax=Nocardia ninae NBRC 108245 TaxID=1210091 RepID=A0A511M6D3_9NOCA|nr:hypothetical protein NN4_03060 [Nocardia ninae NBRC 108245]
MCSEVRPKTASHIVRFVCGLSKVVVPQARNGIGRHLAHRLVHDGETVLDVLAKPFRPNTRIRHRQCTAQPMPSTPTRSRWQHCTPNLRRVEPDPDLLLGGGIGDTQTSGLDESLRGQQAGYHSAHPPGSAIPSEVEIRFLFLIQQQFLPHSQWVTHARISPSARAKVNGNR